MYLKIDPEKVERLICEALDEMDIYSRTSVCIGVVDGIEIQLTVTRDMDEMIREVGERNPHNCVTLHEGGE